MLRAVWLRREGRLRQGAGADVTGCVHDVIAVLGGSACTLVGGAFGGWRRGERRWRQEGETGEVPEVGATCRGGRAGAAGQGAGGGRTAGSVTRAGAALQGASGGMGWGCEGSPGGWGRGGGRAGASRPWSGSSGAVLARGSLGARLGAAPFTAAEGKGAPGAAEHGTCAAWSRGTGTAACPGVGDTRPWYRRLLWRFPSPAWGCAPGPSRGLCNCCAVARKAPLCSSQNNPSPLDWEHRPLLHN